MKQDMVLLLLCASLAACAADLYQQRYRWYDGYSGYAKDAMGRWGNRYGGPYIPKGFPDQSYQYSFSGQMRGRPSIQSQFQTQTIAVIKLLSGGIVTPFGRFTATITYSKNKTNSQAQSQWVGRNATTSNGSSPAKASLIALTHQEDTDLGSETASEEVTELKPRSLRAEDPPGEVSSEEHEDGARDSASEERAEVARSPTSEEREDVARDTTSEEAQNRPIEDREDDAHESASE